ncbi:MAG: DEAD/DEAH box helicase [Candidatus Gottesmanbacteria bacterium]
MYRQFNQRNRGRNNFNRVSSGRSRFGKKIVSFDPTNFINTVPVENKIEEFTVTHTFADFKIREEIKVNIDQRGYKIPTPIQDKAIPVILEGRDLIGIANTGTGKTAAFLIPLINKILNDRSQRVLIITPTRELAAQIRDELFAFARGLNVFGALCIGGANINRQINDIRRNPQFVIGTPGRIQDLINSRNLNLSNFNSVVLDEADRMVDIGFLPNIRYIIGFLPKNRQSLFFSATIDGKVKEVLNNFVQNPVTVSVKTGETTQNIKQDIIKIGNSTKIDELHNLLIQDEYEKVLIFARTKRGVQKLYEELLERGFKVDAIHGNKRQGQRIKALEKFKTSSIQILIATDLASRGLDIPDVTHVINYDLPECLDAYIHRIGRTGRMDKKGIALTFVS